MAEKQQSWRDITRRAMVGDPKPLACTGGELEIRPRKLPQAVADEITELQTSMLIKDGNLVKVREYQAILNKVKAEKREELTEEEAVRLMEVMPTLPAGTKTKVYDLVLRHGIGGHNFHNDQGEPIGEGRVFDEATIAEILEWGPMCEEIAEIVLGYSRPLAKTSQGSSDSSQAGSSTSGSSPKT